MKATGVTRRVDELGRIVLPKELRRTLGIVEKDPMEIFVEDEKIILQIFAQSSVAGVISNVENSTHFEAARFPSPDA